MNRIIPVVRPSLPPLEEYVDQLKDIWNSGIITNQGPKHEELKRALTEYLEVPALTFFSNGHQALELGLESLHLKGEVITTPFTFASTTQAILRNGLTPVFSDIRSDDYTIDPEMVEKQITDRTCAILGVHVYGNLCDVTALEEIGKRHGIPVIYDAAHAFGERYKGRAVGSYGDASMFSFHATKVFNTVEGGCWAYRDPAKEKELNALKQFGQIVGTESTPYIGTNAKMTEVSAALGLCNLKHIGEYILKRRAVVERYRKNLKDIPGIQLCEEKPDTDYNYAYFPVVFKHEETGVSRDMISDALKAHGVLVRKYFYPLCSDFECVRDMGIVSNVPVAKYVSDRVLALPCYSDLALEDVDLICSLIRERLLK